MNQFILNGVCTSSPYFMGPIIEIITELPTVPVQVWTAWSIEPCPLWAVSDDPRPQALIIPPTHFSRSVQAHSIQWPWSSSFLFFLSFWFWLGIRPGLKPRFQSNRTPVHEYTSNHIKKFHFKDAFAFGEFFFFFFFFKFCDSYYKYVCINMYIINLRRRREKKSNRRGS